MYSFALVALKRLLQTSGPNYSIWPCLSPDASVLKKFHFLDEGTTLADLRGLARKAQTCSPIFAHFSLSMAHTPGSASCWKMLSICSGGEGISAATHHLSKVRKAPARYSETTGRGI